MSRLAVVPLLAHRPRLHSLAPGRVLRLDLHHPAAVLRLHRAPQGHLRPAAQVPAVPAHLRPEYDEHGGDVLRPAPPPGRRCDTIIISFSLESERTQVSLSYIYSDPSTDSLFSSAQHTAEDVGTTSVNPTLKTGFNKNNKTW